jgi:cellulose biosynthesis protein BcsQ
MTFVKAIQAFYFDYEYITDTNVIGPVIKKLKESGYDFIFIDTAGFDSSMVTFITANSDLVLVPSKADQNNIVGAVKTYSLIQSACLNMNKDIAVYVVMMDVDRATKITKKVVAEILEAKILLMRTFVGHTTGFKEMLTEGIIHKSGATKRNIEALMRKLQMKNMLEFYKTKLEAAYCLRLAGVYIPDDDLFDARRVKKE